MTDLLSEATRALREAEPSPETAELTRARIMTSVHGARQRRSRKLAFGIPLAAILLGSTAWALSANLPGVWAFVKEVATLGNEESALEVHAPSGRPAVRHAPRASRPPREDVARGESAALPSPEAPREPEATAANPASSRLSHPKDAQKKPPAPSAPTRDPNLELYRAAHQLHFQGGDPAAALSAWDAYLAAAPEGPLAPEARYNRALALVRLGRKAEAVAALTPFARGRFGGYRREEAERLIDALGDPNRERQ